MQMVSASCGFEKSCYLPSCSVVKQKPLEQDFGNKVNCSVLIELLEHPGECTWLFTHFIILCSPPLCGLSSKQRISLFTIFTDLI